MTITATPIPTPLHLRLITTVIVAILTGSLTLLTDVMAQPIQADLTNPGYGTPATRFTVMNLADRPAKIIARYYATAGSLAMMTPAHIVPSLGRLDVSLNDEPALPTAFVGSMTLQADTDIAGVEVVNYTGRSRVPDAKTSVPGAEASVNAGLGITDTGYTLVAPALFRLPVMDNVPARQVSRFNVQNVTGNTANYTITYYAADGTVMGTSDHMSLAPYGSRTLRTDQNADMPQSVIRGPTSGISKGARFSARVVSNQRIAGSAETVLSVTTEILNNGSGDYTLVPAEQAATTLYSPSAFRLCPVNEQAACSHINTHYTTYSQYSSFQLHNTSNFTALVKASFINRDPPVLSYTLDITIPANGNFGVNLFNGGSEPIADPSHPIWTALGARFAGSVIFAATNGARLVGVGNLDFPAPNLRYYGAYNLVGTTDASGRLYAPLFDRICSHDCTNSSLPGSFVQSSAIQIMNVGTTACTIPSIDVLDRDGTIAVALSADKYGKPLLILPGGTIGLNTYNGGSFNISQFDEQLGDDFSGTVMVNASGCQLKGIVEMRNADIGFDQYNAINR
jgi:hypothetical protein